MKFWVIVFLPKVKAVSIGKNYSVYRVLDDVVDKLSTCSKNWKREKGNNLMFGKIGWNHHFGLHQGLQSLHHNIFSACFLPVVCTYPWLSLWKGKVTELECNLALTLTSLATLGNLSEAHSDLLSVK